MIAHPSRLSTQFSQERLQSPTARDIMGSSTPHPPSLKMNPQAHSFEVAKRDVHLQSATDQTAMYATASSMPDQAPFDPQSGHWITITNIPRDEQFPDMWVRTACSLFGSIERVLLASTQAAGDRVDTAFVRFARHEEALAALQLNGREIAGQEPLLATLTGPSPSLASTTSHLVLGGSSQQHTQNVSGPQPNFPVVTNNFGHALNAAAPTTPRGEYRNLYVLNLPLHATSDQLAALFSLHGDVTHCVILSMMDRAARRRGFIDMATHDQAREAIKSLNGYVWSGYPIEVSYAIVQRSNGPLCGPNTARRTVPRSRWNCGPRKLPLESSSPLSGSSDAGVPALGPQRLDRACPGADALDHPLGLNSPVDPYTVSINGLDPVAIIDDDDLWRQLSLYGKVLACSLSRTPGGFSLGHAVATFAETAAAAYACQQLNGRLFNERVLTCQLLPRPVTTPAVFHGMDSTLRRNPTVAHRDAWWTDLRASQAHSDPIYGEDYVRGPLMAAGNAHSMAGRSTSENSVPLTRLQSLSHSTTWPSIYTDHSSATTDSHIPATRSEPWLFRNIGVNGALGDRTNVWGTVPLRAARSGRARDSNEYDFGPIGSGSPRRSDIEDVNSSSPPSGSDGSSRKSNVGF